MNNPWSTIIIIFLVAGVVFGHRPVTGAATPAPAVQFWEKALPGIPMPDSIADLVKEGVDHSPLAAGEQHSNDTILHPDLCLSYRVNCPPPAAAAAVASGLFFYEAAVRVGATMTVSLPPATTTPFLPRDVADKIPFPASTDSHKLADVLAMFKIAQGSTEAAEMSTTLRRCEELPLTGEQTACATSLEGIVETATGMLGGGATWAAASALPADGLPRRKYVVEAVAPFYGTESHVACHSLSWPFAVFQCHTTAGPSKAYMLSLRSGRTAISMASLCHRDTSSWNPEHPAFAILGTHPGGAPVCHFMPYGNLMFGKKATNA